MPSSFLHASGIAVLALTLSACTFGPDYKVPAAELETSFKNAGFKSPPPEGSWWSLFRDAELNRLIRLADKQGPSALAALARYDQARASLGLARVDRHPTVTGDAYAARQSDSGNSNFSAGTYDDYRAALNVSWEVDLWGRVRTQVGVAEAEMNAAQYEYQAAALSLRGAVARAYLSLRFTDAEIALLVKTATIRAEARRLMKKRFSGGASSRLDYERAVTEDESVQSELHQVRAQRGRFENALAALTGQNPSAFRLAAAKRPPSIPSVPSGVPSELLRRRPDIAASERRLAAASDTIGLVIASYLPRISITAEGGVRSLKSSDLFKPNSALWRLGPELQLPTLGGGSIGQNKKLAEAQYREALENYRATLLTAIQETEDSLGDSNHLAAASASRNRGASSAGSVATLTRKRYTAGVTDYFEVVDSERTSLNEQRAALTIDQARALAATRLIQSLGGGWSR